jgi:hypothetical protein
MTHDRCCPLDDADGIECAVCDAIAHARNDERLIYQQTWKANLPRIEARNWLEGYRAATNRRNIPYWVAEGTNPLKREP